MVKFESHVTCREATNRKIHSIGMADEDNFGGFGLIFMEDKELRALSPEATGNNIYKCNPCFRLV